MMHQESCCCGGFSSSPTIIKEDKDADARIELLEEALFAVMSKMEHLGMMGCLQGVKTKIDFMDFYRRKKNG